MGSDVFISYGSRDRHAAQALATRLEDAGYSVWWDREIRAGDNYERVIERAIEQARCVVALWSRSSVESDWVRAEARDGLEREILVPASIDGTRGPLLFRSINTVDLSGWPDAPDQAEASRLLERIEGLLGTTGAHPRDVQSDAIDTGGAPSVAIAPFTVLSPDPGAEMLQSGITQEVIGSLSRLQHFSVISFGTMWQYRDQHCDARTLSRDLGVRYVVLGTIMKSGDTAQIQAEVVDGLTGKQLWSDVFRLTLSLDDIFELQRKLAVAIAGRLQPRLVRAEVDRAMARQPEALQAWELVNRARQPLAGSQQIKEAISNLRRAIELDPNYAEAHALLAAFDSYKAILFGPQHATSAKKLADRAMELEPTNDIALLAAGAACVNLTQYDEGLRYCERAVELNPSSAQAWAILGLARLGRDKDADSALEALNLAMELSPADDQLYIWYHLKGPCFAELGDFESAVEVAQKSVGLYRGWFFSWLCLSQYLAVCGRRDEAMAAWEEAKRGLPVLTPELHQQSVRNFAPVSENIKETIINAMQELLEP